VAFTLAAVELDRVAKRRDLFLYRAVLSLLGALVAVVAGYAMMWSQGLATGSSAYTGGDWLGAVFARVAALLQAAAVLFIAPLLSAGLIVRERRDRTLGLLVLADFNAPDIYLAKFLSAFLGTATLVLSTLPLLALASFLGGMDLNRALLLAGLWTGCAAFACATGLLFSAILPGYRSALVASAVAVILSMCVAWTGLGFVSPLLPPSTATLVAAFPVVANRPGLFAALLGGATLLMAVATIRMLPRLAVEGARSDRRRRRAERRWRRRRRSSPARLAGRILRSAGMERVSVLPTILALALAVAVATPFLLPVAPCFAGAGHRRGRSNPYALRPVTQPGRAGAAGDGVGRRGTGGRAVARRGPAGLDLRRAAHAYAGPLLVAGAAGRPRGLCPATAGRGPSGRSRLEHTSCR
jgi:hypothetical protein